MILILTGIIAFLIMTFVFGKKAKTEEGTEAAVFVGFAIFLIAFMSGLFVLANGYSKWEQKERVELVALQSSTADLTKGNIYVSASAGVYTYCHTEESEFGTDYSSVEYVYSSVSSNVVVIEVPDIEPHMVVFERTGKMSIISFALLHKETQYVFYLPPDSVEIKN